MQTNEEIKAAVAEQVAQRGFAVVSNGTPTRHAAIGIHAGWGGYVHPRALCAPHTPRVYAALAIDQNVDVTCKRCIAGLAKRAAKRAAKIV